jgi:hypothetical protein
MIPRNEILYAPLQPQKNGSPYERNFSEAEIKLFEQIYFECRLKPVFDRILKEMAQEPVNDDNGIDGYGKERLRQYKDQRYVGSLNNPNQSKEEFSKDIEGEIELAKERDGKFNIIRVFNDNDRKTIGYITYCKETANLILNITVFRTAENFVKKKGGVSVIDEMEDFIRNSFMNGIVQFLAFHFFYILGN